MTKRDLLECMDDWDSMLVYLVAGTICLSIGLTTKNNGFTIAGWVLLGIALLYTAVPIIFLKIMDFYKSRNM